MNMNEQKCFKCGGVEFAEGTDFMPIKPLNKKLSFSGSNKIFTFCLNCGEVISTRIENPSLFKK